MSENPCTETGKETGRADDDRRLAVYGLDPNNVVDEPLVIAPGKHVRLSGEGGKTDQRGFARLVPKSLDDVKRWIGVPDELGAKRGCCCELPSGIQGVGSAGDYRKVDVAMRRSLYALAREYVHGDSRRVAAYKPSLEFILDRAIITGCFLRSDIDIYNGAVLEIGADIKVLFARHIRIWRGGLLRITGSAKIDCVSITGDVTGEFRGKFELLPVIGRLIN